MITFITKKMRIQTKVLILVAPLILSVAAVGVTGRYTAQMLEGRMEVSNSVLQSLSGFKDVFSSISQFLMQPTEALHKAALDDAAKQLELLQIAADDLRQTSDVSVLDAAIEQSHVIPQKIDSVWSLTLKQQEIVANVEAAMAQLAEVQADIGKHLFSLMGTAKNKENANKTAFKGAAKLSAAATLLTQLVRKETLPSDPASFSTTLTDNKTKIMQVIDALPKAKSLPQPLDGATQATLTGLTDFLNGKAAAPSQAAVAAAGDALKVAADLLLNTALTNLALSEEYIEQANTVAGKLRAITNGSNDIRIVFAELKSSPNLESVKKVQASLYSYAGHVKALTDFMSKVDFFADLPQRAKPLLDALSAQADNMLANADLRREEFNLATRQIDETWNLLAQFAESQKTAATSERQQANVASLTAMIGGTVIALFAAATLALALKRPITRITNAMRRISEGELATAISDDGRRDEIGDMARALSVFKANALAKIAIEQDADAARKAGEDERAENERQRAASHAEVNEAINALAVGLERLSRGELNFSLDVSFAGQLDRLRQNFNASVRALGKTLSDVKQTSDVIHHSGGHIAKAVQNLSQRTENQAAAVEEAASAIEQISATVSNTSSKTSLALGLVQEAKQNADESALVVQEAVNAMRRIRDASEEISNILALIDDIAFQTNLLALNAGVEAARAGEAGKGFAVVAHEVRELAQRCAQSSRKINGLIRNSAHEVSNGARCVANTSDALGLISQRVTDIFGHIEAIAASTHEQASSLREINTSISGIDSMTQENAAMVEETHVATGCLSNDTDFLAALIDRFVLDNEYQESNMADAA